MEDKPVQPRKFVEDRNQANPVSGKNKEKEGEDQGRPGHDPLTADVRLRDVVPHEFYDRFQSTHEPGRNEAVLAKISPHRDRHDQEDKRRNKPEHEDVFSHGKIDTKHGWKLNQRKLTVV